MEELTDREVGYLLGVLAGEGHFGGDGRQPHITLRMHTRHADLFHWIERRLPKGKLYGPYHHANRSYYQWMARGQFLREEFAPFIAKNLDLFDAHVAGRFQQMCEQYDIEV